MSEVPKPPDQRTASWDPDSKLLESIVLATIHAWVLCHHKPEIVTLIQRHFVASDVYDALCVLADSAGLDKPKHHRDTPGRSAGELFASEVYDMLYSLSANKTLPKIVVSSMLLPMVPLATLTTKDDVSISSRLESLENGLKKLTDCVTKAAIGSVRQQPAVLVTPPTGQSVQQQQQVNGELQIPPPTFAAVAGNGGGTVNSGGAGNGGGQQRGRLRSQGQGQKRDRAGTPVGEREGEQPFQQVNNRRRRPVNHGSSRVEVEEAGVAAPIEIYVGNTTPAATEEVVKAVLIKCAKALEPQTDFCVVEVVQLAQHIDNPRTKCWKVVIPHKFKDIIEKDELYPSGWCHRKFFAPRSGQPAKQARKDEAVVQEAIKEQQRLKEAEKQEQEDRSRAVAEENVAKASAPVMEDISD